MLALRKSICQAFSERREFFLFRVFPPSSPRQSVSPSSVFHPPPSLLIATPSLVSYSSHFSHLGISPPQGWPTQTASRAIFSKCMVGSKWGISTAGKLRNFAKPQGDSKEQNSPTPGEDKAFRIQSYFFAFFEIFPNSQSIAIINRFLAVHNFNKCLA